MISFLRYFCVVFVLLGVVVSTEADCNGFGQIYADSPNECECYQCYYGSQCQNLNSSCIIDSTGGNPGMYQEYWNTYKGHTLDIALNYRTEYDYGYVIAPGTTLGLHGKLMQNIVSLHQMTKNANAEGKYIVTGYGCTFMLAAMQYAFSKLADLDEDMPVFAQTPYFSGYPNPASYLRGIEWNPSTSLNPEQVIEIVTIPNNPDGALHKPYYNSPYTAADMVYYWPSLVNITTQQDYDVMLFSLSKLSGHAGSRFGWALVKDEQVAALMGHYLAIVTVGVSVDDQYRALDVLEQLVSTKPADGLFAFVKNEMASRWAQIENLFDGQTRFSQLSVPGTFYVWLQCNDEADSKDCAGVFASVGVSAEAGTAYGASAAFCRLEMVEYSPVFALLIERITPLFTA